MCHLHKLKRLKEVESLEGGRGLGAEHKPGMNGNVGFAVKEHAKTTCHDIHANYQSMRAF